MAEERWGDEGVMWVDGVTRSTGVRVEGGSWLGGREGFEGW